MQPDPYRAEALYRIFKRHEEFIEARTQGKDFSPRSEWGRASSDYAGDESKTVLSSTAGPIHARDPGSGTNSFYSERYPRLAPALWPHLSAIMAVNSGKYAEFGERFVHAYLKVERPLHHAL